MENVIAITILLAIFAFGEWVADKSKAILSAALVMAVTLLIAFWLGLPGDIFQTAAVNEISMILISFLIVSLGTSMNLKELGRQWKTVIISFFGVVLGVVTIILIAPLFMDKVTAIAGSPIYAGANVAALMMKDALEQTGNTEIFQFCLLLLVTQNFVGIPIASMLLRREAKIFLKNSENIEKFSIDLVEDDTVNGNRKKLFRFPESLNKPSVILTKLGMIAILSHYISSLTNGKIHTFVAAIIFGVLFTELGFLDTNSLAKSGASTFIIFCTTIIIFSNLATTTPGHLISMLPNLLLCLGLGTVGVLIAGFVTGKILKVSPFLAIAQGLTCTFGFPTTLFIPNEVAKAIGKNEKEEKAIVNYLLPKMLVAGFVTVTITSVFLAGIVIDIYFS